MLVKYFPFIIKKILYNFNAEFRLGRRGFCKMIF
jgi:hypothetical protein